ncbi:protein ORANGE-LIKE, chloroplastic isoform X2 [Diospyros lotus]|uniref:protein ORANGE-LIKE, chloroplastic isoform X2 n=1 Tax=Diospyros lotus TaxID=55363 RepID=UPI00224DEA3F|nr:protein ORANGE-LIKE, chloroplastic isoform X2 [Diospyros lotus]
MPLDRRRRCLSIDSSSQFTFRLNLSLSNFGRFSAKQSGEYRERRRREMSSLSTNSHNLSSLLISNSRLNSSSYPLIFLRASFPGKSSRRLSFSGKASPPPTTACSSYAKDSSAGSPLPGDSNPSNFCIIEGPETVQDFVQMQMQEIQDNIRSRRNKIFLLMEEVRRLRIQQRLRSIKDVGDSSSEEYEMPDIPSSIPFLPHTPMTLKQLYLTSFSFITGIIVFGGLLAPILELKLGLGGTSYEDFIRSLHLPMQLSQVDPIVASFSGGAVGVISTLMLLEANNVERQEKKRCKYCHGTGYLACVRCSASGVCLKIEPISVVNPSDRPLRPPTTQRCLNCSGAGKVMCPTCLCTGMVMASEHDPRIDPFD